MLVLFIILTANHIDVQMRCWEMYDYVEQQRISFEKNRFIIVRSVTIPGISRLKYTEAFKIVFLIPVSAVRGRRQFSAVVTIFLH